MAKRSPVELYWKPGWTGCVKAREFLAHKVGEGEGLKLRNVIKDRLSRDEIAQLVARVGDPSLLVAPKRRGQAEGLAGDALLDWLAADGSHLRRPIVVVGGQVLLGFTAEVKAKLEAL